MSKYSQKPIDGQMHQQVNDNRNYQRQHQSVTAIGTGTRDDPAKRTIEWIAYRHDESYEPGAAARCQQSQKESQSQQGVEHKEKIVHDLRDASYTASALDLALALHNFVHSFATEFARNLLHASVFTRRSLGSVFGYLRLHFSLDLRFHRAVLLRPE